MNTSGLLQSKWTLNLLLLFTFYIISQVQNFQFSANLAGFQDILN